MKNIVAYFILALTATAQEIVVTWDSRFHAEPVTTNQTFDVARLQSFRDINLRQFPAPCVVRLEQTAFASITTTVDAAIASLPPMEPEELPGRRASMLADLTHQDLMLVRSYLTNDVDVLFGGISAAQRRYMKTERALLRALIRAELKEVRE